DGHALRPGHRLGHRARPLAVRLILELAHWPVPDDGTGVFHLVDVDGPRLRADIHADRALRDYLADVAVGRAEFSHNQMISGEYDLAPAQLKQLPCQVGLVGFKLRVADTLSLRFQEGVRHRAADQHLVDSLEDGLDEADLVRDLAAAEDAEHGPGRRRQQL